MALEVGKKKENEKSVYDLEDWYNLFVPICSIHGVNNLLSEIVFKTTKSEIQ